MKPAGVSYGAFLNVTDSNVLSWRAQLAMINQLPGRDHVEVWLESVPRSPRERRLLRRELAGEAVIVHAPFIGLSLVSPWKELRSISLDKLLRCIDVSCDLDAKVVTIHPGDAPAMESKAAVTSRFLSAYSYLQERAGGLFIAAENMPKRNTVTQSGVTSTGDFANLLLQSPDMRFTLDIGHALQNGDHYGAFLTSNSHAIANIHLHDGVGGGRAHLAIGEGELDVDQFFLALNESRFAGYVSLETLGFGDTRSSWQVIRRCAGGVS
jgi:sugar phosphate isomerase/epimerase